MREWWKSSRMSVARRCRSDASAARLPEHSSARCASAIRPAVILAARIACSWKGITSSTGRTAEKLAYGTALCCGAHHRYVHEYGYAIELGPDQRPRFRDPHGRLIAEVPERPVRADLGWPRIRAGNAPLSITADTLACGWDGTPADYGEIVGHLLVVDGLRESRTSAPQPS